MGRLPACELPICKGPEDCAEKVSKEQRADTLKAHHQEGPDKLHFYKRESQSDEILVSS